MTVKPQGHRWRKLRKQLRTQAQARNEPCWLCGRAIDWTAPPQSPWSYEPDHVLPRWSHPHLAMELSNMRTSHTSCNRKRGSKPAIALRRSYSRWSPAVW